MVGGKMRRPGKASRNPEEVAGRKWPAVQAGVVLWSGPGLKVDLADSFI